jgi:hypothetical protein
MIPRRVWLPYVALAILIVPAASAMERPALKEVWRRATDNFQPALVQLPVRYHSEWERRLAAIEGSVRATDADPTDGITTGSISPAE